MDDSQDPVDDWVAVPPTQPSTTPAPDAPTANDWITVAPTQTLTEAQKQAAIRKYGGWRSGDDPAKHGMTLDEFRKAHPVLMAPESFLEGVGAGVVSLPVGLSEIAHKVIPGIPEIPKEYADPSPLGLPGKAGKLVEQTAEFMLPATKFGRVLEAAPKIGPLLKASPWAARAARIGTDAAIAGGQSFLESGGDPRAGAESAATVGLLGGLGSGVSAGFRATAVPVFQRMVLNQPRPLSPAAIALAKKYGIPLTQGMLGGSKTVQAIEKMLGHTIAPDLYEAILEEGQQGLVKGASKLASGFGVDEFAAGDNSLRRITGAATRAKGVARNFYDKLDQIQSLPQNIKTIITGYRSTPSTLINPATGQLLPPTLTPITERIALPMNMTGWKNQFAPVIKEMEKTIPEAKLAYSDSYKAMKELMAGPDIVSAKTAEENLSRIKEIVRETNSDKVQWRGGQIVDALQPDVDKAVAAGGQEAIDALKGARQAWAVRSKYLDLAEEMSGDRTGMTGQTDAAKRLLRPADASYPLLQRVLAVDPGARADLARATLGKVFKKSTYAGEFTNPKEAQNIWNAVGKRTKAALFPWQQRTIDNFLQLARRVNENPNTSGTGIVNSLLKLGLFVSHPVQTGASIVLGRQAAKVLYYPEAASALQVLMSGGPGSVEATKAMTLLQGMVSQGARADAARRSRVKNESLVPTVDDWVSVPRARGGRISDPLKRIPSRAAVLRSLTS